MAVNAPAAVFRIIPGENHDCKASGRPEEFL